MRLRGVAHSGAQALKLEVILALSAAKHLATGAFLLVVRSNRLISFQPLLARSG